MRTSTRHLAALVAAAGLVAACGGGGSSGEDPSAVTDGGDAATAQHGGTLVVQQTSDACCGTPFGTQDPSVMQILSGTVFSKLVEFAAGEDLVEPEIVPDLAESWEVSEDGLTYTFDLRDDVTWHDLPPVDGRPFVADDVVATFEKLQEGVGERYPDDESGSMVYPHTYMVDMVTAIEAPDDHTVVFELDQVYSPFLENLAYHFNYIHPREAVDGEYDSNETWIGTGPFMVESYTPDTEWVLVRNPDYFIEDRPFLDRLELPIMGDFAAVQAGLRSGRLDVGFTQNLEEAESLEANHDLQVLEQAHLPVTFYLNPEVEPFDDLRVRRAIMMAVDWVAMGEAIRGQIAPSSYIRPDLGDPALSPDEIAEIRPYDPDLARELLAEAGHADGFSAGLLIQQRTDDDVREGQWIAQDLADIGVDVEIEVTDAGTATERRRAFQFEMHKAGRSTHLADQTWIDFMPGSLDNHTQVDNERLIDLFEQARGTLDDDDRHEIYREMQRHTETEIASVLYPYQAYQYTLANPRVQDLATSFIFQGRRFADVWIDE